MQTNFSTDQLKEPDLKHSNEALRTCVHCGFCTATCPTYQILGDELDSPRGRIYLIKDMLENNRDPDKKTVKHIDRCLSCLGCVTTCPSGVDYMHLIDHARSYIEKRYTRPILERILRSILAGVLPHPGRLRFALILAKFVTPFASIIPSRRIRALLMLSPKKIPPPSRNDDPQIFTALNGKRKRVALMTGCAQTVLNTDINDATIRILRRYGCEVVIAKGQGCCGGLTHHMGKVNESHRAAKTNISAWIEEIEGAGLDAIIINTSGCGTTVKDYAHIFRNDHIASGAIKVSDLAMDISEFLSKLDIKGIQKSDLNITYHSACSLQHGQTIKNEPKDLLRSVGYRVTEPTDAHLCCGSAGTYNIMQPEISQQLRDRKISTINATAADVVSTGNLGCMLQIGSATNIPVVHTVELLDWATGGPKPSALG
jgi:glycolate oxidase iron-sulfur subunit